MTVFQSFMMTVTWFSDGSEMSAFMGRKKRDDTLTLATLEGHRVLAIFQL